MNIAAWKCYKCYLAMKMHFTSDYDIVKYQGKIKATNQAFFQRHNIVLMFQKLAKKYQGDELINYLLANFVNNPKWSLDQLNSEESRETFLKWKKRNESLSYVYRQDLERLLNIHNQDVIDETFFYCSKTGNNIIEHPLLLREYLSKKICIETLVILNKIYDYVKDFDIYMSNDPLWKEVSTLIKNYSPFIKINKETFNGFKRDSTAIAA